MLTVLCNVAEKGPAYCQRLWPGPLLPCLLNTVTFSDTEVVGQSLELLQLLFFYQPEVGFCPWPFISLFRSLYCHYGLLVPSMDVSSGGVGLVWAIDYNLCLVGNEPSSRSSPKSGLIHEARIES